MLLLAAMLFSMVPALQLGASAAFTADDGKTYAADETRFLTAADDGITMLNNGKNISLSIKVNNFVNDGLLFEYLSSTRSANNADDYVWEYCKDVNKQAWVQLYPYKLRNQDLGQGAGDTGHGLADADGFVGVKTDGTLDSLASTTGDYYGTRSDGTTNVVRTIIPYTYTDDGDTVFDSDDETAFLRLYPSGSRDSNGNNPDGTAKGRAWVKLTTFASTQKVDNIRYAVVIYRLPIGVNYNSSGARQYSNFGLTVNYFDEATGNCSKYVSVDPEGGSEWQYAIIDLMGLGSSDSRRITTGTNVTSVYLQLPLAWNKTSYYMDVAAVGYFPYYGDAEQFAYYGLTLGCKQKYFAANNAGFNFRGATSTYDSTNANGIYTKTLVESLPDWVENQYGSAQQIAIDTYSTLGDNQVMQDLTTIAGLETTLGYNLFGSLKGYAGLGLVESTLGENGLPQYKKSVIEFVATYLRHQLMAIPEYPYDNNGWRNYSYITGSSTSGGTNEALFGTNDLGQSIDLATAICQQLGVEKGAGVVSGTDGRFAGGSGQHAYSTATTGNWGSYADTMSHADELIGTFDECIGNINSWWDAAYFLLHNLYVTDSDIADAQVDGYGEYENDYQTLILPQVQLSTGATAYFFDSGYAYNTSYDADGDGELTGWEDRLYTSALVYDKSQHTISLQGDAQGKAQFCDSVTDQTFASYFPFLLTSGNDTQQGESNTPYYLHGGALSRYKYGTTYRDRDFHYALSGNGYFAYKEDLYFNFEGDDDVYVFINGQLVVDIGATHSATTYEMDLDDYVDWAWAVKNGTKTYKGSYYSALSADDKARVDGLCLVTGGVYSFDFFYMERHGIGSNLRIITNMEITESGLAVDKFAYQNGNEVADNGMVDVDQMIEYGFSITNNSDSKLYDLTFSDDIIGLTLDSTNGLVYSGSNITNSYGAKLTASDLVITVTGFDAQGVATTPVSVTCATNEELMAFLEDLDTNDGTDTSDETSLYAGSGLWKDATITIRGIFYSMTDEQKSFASFTNIVEATGKGSSTEGDYILTGQAKHTVYQPGNPAYYQWVGHSIVIEREKLLNDLIEGGVVAPSDLPAPGNMILIPSNASGTEVAADGFSNIKGGDVYVEISYSTVGTYMAYITILDEMDPGYRLTVPVTVYAVGGQDSVFVLDYGLDTYLTENDAIMEYEIDAAVGNVTGSVMGIAEDGTDVSYEAYKDSNMATAIGNTENEMELLTADDTYSDGVFTSAQVALESPIYLDHAKSWVIEWKGIMSSSPLMFSMEEVGNTSGNRYMYIRRNTSGCFIALGYHTGAAFANYGVVGLTSGTTVYDALYDTSTAHVYRVYNKPAGDGSNMVYVSIDGTEVGPMINYWEGGTNKNTTDTWVSGKDFTFNFLGDTTASRKLSATIDYLRVYEDGEQRTHYHWDARSGASYGIGTYNTSEVGYVTNYVTFINSSYTSSSTTYTPSYTYDSTNDWVECFNEARWSLAKNVVLNHDRSWEVEFTVGNVHSSMMVFSSVQDVKTAGSKYLFIDPNTNLVTLGYYDTSLAKYINYAVDIDDAIASFSMGDMHTYVLKNQLNPDGSNMVYLYVDGTKVGALDTHIYNTDTDSTYKTNDLSGMDFTFCYIGGTASRGMGLTSVTDYGGTYLKEIYVRCDTGLRRIYEWTPGANILESVVYTESSGNQINFTKDTDGVVSVEDGQFTLSGNDLKFHVTDFMDDCYSAYVALTIHEQGFVPSRLEDDAIDISKEVQLYKKVTVLPANVVYYEDDFAMIHYMGTPVDTFEDLTKDLVSGYDDYSDTYYLATGSSSGLTQSPDQDTPYGSDPTYSDISTNVSGGTLHTIAINNDGPLAWFSFTGRGFEIEARTNATNSGTVMVEVYLKDDVTITGSGSTATLTYDIADAVEVIPVISEFDNGNTVNGSFQGNNGGSESIYQVPLIQYTHSTVEEMVVVISGVENVDYYNNEAHIDSYLYLDGIRIFRPLGTDVSYQDENGNVINHYGDQNNAVFNELRDYIVNGDILALNYNGSFSASTGTLTITEKYNNKTTEKYEYIGSAVTNVDDYFMEGPNNEVYLEGTFTNGAIAFYVRESTATNVGATKLLHLGARAIDMGLYHGAGSTGMKANLMLGVQTADGIGWNFIGTVTSATEQYYNVNYRLCPTVTINGLSYYQVVIKVESFSDDIPAMVSFTNLKRTSGLLVLEDQFTAADLTLNDVTLEQTVDTEAVSYGLLRNLSAQMASTRYVSVNEVESGSAFEADETVTTQTPVITPKYPSLSLDGEVSYNIYFDIENMTDIDTGDMGLMLFDSLLADGTIEDAIDVIPGAVYIEANGYYVVHTNGVSAKKLGDDIYFKVYAQLADGTYVYSNVYSYNAIEYAEDVLASSSSDEMKALCVAMLNYGAAAQTYFGYKTDALMNAGLTAEQQALVASYSSDIVSDVTVDSAKVGSFVYSNGGFAGASPSVSFEGTFAINYYITPNQTVDTDITLYYWTQDAYESASQLSAENASGSVVMEKLSDGRYTFSYSDIAAKEVDQAVYISAVYTSNGTTYCTGVIGYSIGVYCDSLISKSSDEAVRGLAAATALYGHYAEEYFA